MCSIFCTATLKARETFEMNIGEHLVIYADKGFHDSTEKKFNAVGNVIISFGDNTIYGAKASLDFEKKIITVLGNVRFVGKLNTFYGVSLIYHISTQKMILNNSRILSDRFIILGKKITKDSSNIIIADEAEYTTCRDCPSSWSIYGEKVKIVKNEYIYITHAFFKMKGTVVMYFPYIVLPVKNKRETGLLFPSFGFDGDNGTFFLQPWYWVINQHSDMTMSPAKWGDRGTGLEVEYRYAHSDFKWFELNTALAKDTKYNAFKNGYTSTEGSTFRHLSGIEYNFSSFKDFNSHLFYQFTKDSDFYRDFDFVHKQDIRGAEAGLSTFAEYRSSYLNFSLESFYMKNILYNDSYRFDKRYVQILPKVTIASTPFVLFQRNKNFFNKVTFSFNSDVTSFRQIENQEQFKNTITGENLLIRNATRLNLYPKFGIYWGMIKDILFTSRLKLDYQSYHFPYQKVKNFSKGAVIYETSSSINFIKEYGKATLNRELNNDIASVFSEKSSQIIGKLPLTEKYTSSKNYTVLKTNSYRHNQEWKLTHRYIQNLKTKGNKDFLSQVSDESGDGLFDRLDAFRDQQDRIRSQNTKTLIPQKNSIELQWNNTLIKKSIGSYTQIQKNNNKDNNKDKYKLNYSYSNLLTFNVSQGIILDQSIKLLKNKLTRLAINSQLNISPFAINFSEYYFYDQGIHQFSLGATYGSPFISLSSNFYFSEFASPNVKQAVVSASFRINQYLTLGDSIDYDLDKSILNKSTYSMSLNPQNNCWKLDLSYTRTQAKKKSIAINFLINFSGGTFQAL